MKKLLVLFFLLQIATAYSQLGKNGRFPNYFGFQVRAIIPSVLSGGTSTISDSNNFLTQSIRQLPGISYGANVRVGLTELIAIETGINYLERKFEISAAVLDSNFSVSTVVSYIQYDIPLNGLIYIKLANEIYATAALGFSVSFKPTNIRKDVSENKNLFVHQGYTSIANMFGASLNANIGFEYRTKKSGFFNIGASAQIPFSKLFDIRTTYVYVNTGIRSVYQVVNGSYLSIDLRYFFHNSNRSGSIFQNGPIE